tara:strand:+ start:40 stop:654 length:615 start_codon:yes stop_codon:yes gene_type:complete
MAKRLCDLAGASLGLFLFSPLLIAIAIVIKLTSPGPVFYRGVRSGRHGKPFRIFKFRTMVEFAERLGGHSTARDDARLTKVGPVLRKYKLDELPQLLNVLVGDMSLVGPRPQVEYYTALYQGEELEIMSVKPGITDYASMEFIDLDNILGNEDVDTKYKEQVEPVKNRLRLRYVREASLWVDFKILVMTCVQLFRIRKKWNTET